MNDIRPPKRPVVSRAQVTPEPTPVEVTTPPPAEVPIVKPKKSKRRWFLATFGIMVSLLLIACVGGFLWYKHELRPVSADKNAAKVRLEIEQGMTPGQIATKLKNSHLIRSEMAFNIYIRLHHVRDRLQAGTYSLSPLASTPELVQDLTSGKVDTFTITFLPGATLKENKAVLMKAGYASEDIDKALAATYDHPLFATKPAGTDLEGYLFGDTYTFPAGATVEDILGRSFDEYYTFIKQYDLVAAFKKQKLTLYQGIVLASIIQREVSSTEANEPSHDQSQVAQVFLKRLREGTVLGSDVTYKYAAKEFGLLDDPSQDSPYNTRKVKGLPPGPIATPGGGALRAVANPASGNYLYFLAGDDGKTYFAHTNAQHEANIQNHCKVNCAE